MFKILKLVPNIWYQCCAYHADNIKNSSNIRLILFGVSCMGYFRIGYYICNINQYRLIFINLLYWSGYRSSDWIFFSFNYMVVGLHFWYCSLLTYGVQFSFCCSLLSLLHLTTWRPYFYLELVLLSNMEVNFEFEL